MAKGQRWKAKRAGLRSGFELRIREWLDSKAGIQYGYEDRKYRYVVPESKHIYTPDFNIYDDAGRLVFTIEAKGNFPATDRKKLLYVREANPELDLRLMFQRDNFIRKNSKTRYSDWAEKNGFKYCIGNEVPYEWLLERITLHD